MQGKQGEEEGDTKKSQYVTTSVSTRAGVSLSCGERVGTQANKPTLDGALILLGCLALYPANAKPRMYVSTHRVEQSLVGVIVLPGVSLAPRGGLG